MGGASMARRAFVAIADMSAASPGSEKHAIMPAGEHR